MSQIHLSLVFNRKKQLNKEGKALIQICAYHLGKRKYFSTDIYIKPKEWDLKRGKINSYHSDHNELNDELDSQISHIKEVIKHKKEKGEQITLSKVSDVKEYKIYSSFYDFMEEEIEKSILKESTKKTHRRTLLVLREFRRELNFDEIDVTFLINFERYLYNQNYAINTVYKYFKNIRTYVNRAILIDLMEMNNYPFKKFKLKQIDGTRDFLTPDELHRLEKLDFSFDKKLEKVKDIFLMSCYCGIRFSDIVHIKKDSFYNIAEIKWLQFTMEKSTQKGDESSKKEVKMPISKMFAGKAITIYERYKDDKKYLFDDFTNQEINKLLKDIETKFKSGKKLTFHVARHTCATNLIYHGVPLSTVQKILGHDKIETTQLYAKVLDMTIVNDLKDIKF